MTAGIFKGYDFGVFAMSDQVRRQDWHRSQVYTRLDQEFITVDDIIEHRGFFLEPWTEEPFYVSTGVGEYEVVDCGQIMNVHRAEGYKTVAYPRSTDYYELFQFFPESMPVIQMLEGMGCKVQTIGTVDMREKCYISVELPNGFDLPGYTEGKHILNMGSSFGRTTSVVWSLSEFLIVCANTFAAHLVGVPALWKASHSASLQDRFEEGKRMLETAIGAADQVVDTANQLLNETFIESEFEKLVEGLLDERPDEAGRSQTTWDNKRMGLMGRWFADDLKDVTNTKWAALMAVQGFEQHVVGKSNVSTQDARNIRQSVFGQATPLSTKAATLLEVGV